MSSFVYITEIEIEILIDADLGVKTLGAETLGNKY